MSYPTIEQVEVADHETICRWWRFLPSPGSAAIPSNRAKPRDYEKFQAVLEKEAAIMNKIKERLDHFGGFTPEISKSLGWG